MIVTARTTPLVAESSVVLENDEKEGKEKETEDYEEKIEKMYKKRELEKRRARNRFKCPIGRECRMEERKRGWRSDLKYEPP